jgi:hypothetical protein
MQIVSANGANISAVGYGTYGMARGDMFRMIPEALKAGCQRSSNRPTRAGRCLISTSISQPDAFCRNESAAAPTL